MKKTVYRSDFHDAFIGNNNFSYEGLNILFDYFEDFGSDAGEEVELDAVAIRSEYTEDEAVNIASNYDIDIREFDDSDDQDQEIFNKVLEHLEQHTTVCGHYDTTIIYQDY